MYFSIWRSTWKHDLFTIPLINGFIPFYITLKYIETRPWVSGWLNDTHHLVPKLLVDVDAWDNLHICLASPGCGRSFYLNLGELCSEKGSHDTCPVFYILLPEMECSTAKVSKLNEYIKSPAVWNFPYILWRSGNSFLIEMERNECVYDCVCVWPQWNSAVSLLTHRSRAKWTTCRSRQFTIRFLEHFRLIRISIKFIYRSPSDNRLW